LEFGSTGFMLDYGEFLWEREREDVGS